MSTTVSLPFLVVYGPTGVGKTDLVDLLAEQIPCEIINMDSGQFYEPLTIGTAKPAWRNGSVPHHLFDIISKPSLTTVAAYREQVCSLIVEINKRGRLPILVGGSGFYLKSLLFPPQYSENSPQESYIKVTAANTLLCWNQLQDIDPVRAAAINPHDTYRIQRALDIWYQSGIKPSELKPVYDPPGQYHVVYLTRDKAELHMRIAQRTQEMLSSGWIKETRNLSESWINWIKEKKIIGYTSILAYLEGTLSYQEMVEAIVHKTTQYAKRQETFWRMLKKEIIAVEDSSKITELNLTTEDIHLYIMKLSKNLVNLLTSQAKCHEYDEEKRRN